MEIHENLDLENLDGEIWKVIEGHEDYCVSNFSRIKSFKYNKIGGKILTQIKNSNGYFCIKLCNKHKRINILIFETFNNYRLKENECVHHKDENKVNNFIDNLELMTKKKHRELHMKGDHNPMFRKHPSKSKRTRKLMREKHQGENNPRSILTKEKVIGMVHIIRIRKYLDEGILTQEEIGKKFNVSQSTISAIKNNRVWKHVI